MSQNKTTRIRAKSAKLYEQRKRPLSGKNLKVFDKTDFIQKVYSNIPTIQQRPTSGRQKPKVNSVHYSNTLFNHQGVIQKQVLIEQNMELKKKIHSLQQALAQLNGKFQASKTKVSKFTKHLNVQFQNENLWTGKNSYLVTGVKSQYQNLKNKYKQKCQQLNYIKNQVAHTSLKQQIQLNQGLKKQNQKIIQMLLQSQNLNKTAQHSVDLSKGLMQITNKTQQQKVNQFIIRQLYNKTSELQQKLLKSKKQNEQMKQQLKIQHTKIKFLQKLIIEKDNAIHAFHRKNKKLEKDKNVYIEEISALNNRIMDNKQYYERLIADSKEKEEKIINYERVMFRKQIEEKSTVIEKLEKQVAYLTTLLSYWKPLDEENQANNNHSYHKDDKSSHHQHHSLHSKKEQQEKSIKQSNYRLPQNISLNIGKSISGRISMQYSQNQKTQSEQQVIQPRQQKRADKKRKQTAEKTRKVKESQVQQIGQIIRFRLIAQRKSIEQVKKLFNYQTNQQLSEQQNTWNNEYINMRQCWNILKQSPFLLIDQQGKLMSRYLIQDATNDYIYCDEQNQNKRGIVKSILKSIIGDYQVQKQQEKIKQETQIQLGKYKSKISTILQQMYPAGLITKKKLLQIFVGSGFQIQQDIMEYIIGKLALESENLNNLKYRILF